MREVDLIQNKYQALSAVLDERARRLWAATEARALGRGAVTIVASATGLARNTIYAGLHERSKPLSRSKATASLASRTRRPGGGRKTLIETDPHEAWASFWTIGCAIAALNREALRRGSGSASHPDAGRARGGGGGGMIDARRVQRTFGDGFVAECVADLQEARMRHANTILDDDALVAAVDEALGRRHPKSRTRGRRAAPAELVLRLLVLKHLRNWSDAILEREVRANLVYRDFTRVGGGKVPDAKTMGRWGIAVGPAVVETLHGRLIAMAQQQQVVEGRKMRVDTTVVETNIHYPTDSSLLGDGVRVLTRTMKKVTAIAGTGGATRRDRRRSVTRRLWEIGRIARSKTAQRQEKLTRAYQHLLAATSRVVGQAKRFSREIGAGVKRAAEMVPQAALKGLRDELDTMVLRVRQVIRQTRARILERYARRG